MPTETGRSSRGFRRPILSTVLVAAGLSACIAGATAEPLRLSMPLDCEPGKTCFIQSHVDVDPGAGQLDFRCGSATYDTHTGVDFRLLSAAAAARGVAVLAAAPGVIKGRRDGMADRFADRAATDIKGRECGNGVVVDHGDGWETQYCHLRAGSVVVAQGQQVRRGDKLGEVGFSGLAQFAHLHLTVRRGGTVIEPFSGRPVGDRTAAEACRRDGDAAVTAGLWAPDVSDAFPYRGGEIMMAGFAGGPVAHARLEFDHDQLPATSPTADALVLFVRVMNVRNGDRLRLTAEGPSGFEIATVTEPIVGNKATFTSFAGRKRRGQRWPAGEYRGRVAIVRDGREIAERAVSTTLP